ncbi:MAG: hypothetical protein WAK91_00920 [Candidatus Acidiferrales bacterium]|jgi:hypothetical protein
MKAAFRIAIAALLLTSFSPAGIAQMGMMHTPDMSGIWNPVIGAGGSYEMQSADAKTRHLDIFIAGKESVGGKDAYWLEMAMEGGQRPGAILVKTLTIVDATNSQASRTIIQMQGQPPMEMSEQMMGGHQASKYSDIRGQGQNMGSETITVPAGTFVCDHWHSNNGGDVWISAKVPPFGLVKSVSKDGNTTVLAHVLTDAKDRITGTPVPFDPMRMMQQGRPPQ